jgi:integrase
VLEEIGASTPIKSITTGTVRELGMSLQSQGLAPATINRIVGSLGRMLTVAAEEQWIDRKPKIVKVEVPAKEARFLNEEELTRLFAGLLQVNQEAHDLAVFLLWTGCRVGEALSLEWKHVDLDAGRVTFTKTKTNQNRTVPVPQRALKVLKRRAANPQPFVIKQDTFGKQWNRVKQVVGLEDAEVTPHTLRHTCASRLVMSGVSLYEVARWLGHTSISTTQIYAHLAPDHLKGAAEVLEMKYDPEEG